VSGHHDYEALRKAQRESEAAAVEASKFVPVGPYEALHETHRQVAETLAQQPKERSELEWAEFALARDATHIRNLRDEKRESPAEIGYREQRYELEPLDEKIRRVKIEIARVEEVEKSRAYYEGLKSAQAVREKRTGAEQPFPSREFTDEDRLRIAKLAQQIEQVETFEKERETVPSRDGVGRTR
jgi:hypothetical protein